MLRRLRQQFWTLVQMMAAATISWFIAEQLAGHPDPFFAPIAAISALSASLLERGLMALRLLLGVLLGIVIGEFAGAMLGGGYVAIAAAVFWATAVAAMLGSARVVVVQAAAGAILTVVVADGDIGLNRLIDALIGAGVALIFSQMLFSPEPIRLLRRAQRLALGYMADGLEMTAQALEQRADAPAERAMARLRQLRDRLTELGRVRHLSSRSTRHSLIWRSRMHILTKEISNAGQLDLLAISSLMLIRSTFLLQAPDRDRLAPFVRELSCELNELAKNLDDVVARQQIADRAFRMTHAFADTPETATATLEPAISVLRMVAADIMVFAGVKLQDAREAVRQGAERSPAASLPPSVDASADHSK
jgi:uncharacterized membrane protein YgaE (UPF0421/DUF939 family)